MAGPILTVMQMRQVITRAVLAVVAATAIGTATAPAASAGYWHWTHQSSYNAHWMCTTAGKFWVKQGATPIGGGHITNYRCVHRPNAAWQSRWRLDLWRDN